jgi:hypothetical protein
MNDLWKYNGRNWTWISGSSSGNEHGSYGDKGVPSPSNVPGGRESSTGWRDNDGNLWMFGGVGYDERSNTTYGLQSTMKYYHNLLC